MQRTYTPRELLKLTMPFVWAKLFLRLIATAISIALFALGIWLALSGIVGMGIALVLLFVGPMIYFVIVRIFGYGVRVGHIAVLTETIKNGELPNNQIIYGKQKVKERIGTAATFFFINKLIDRAVQQLQAILQRTAGILGMVPGMSALVGFGQAFVKQALKFVDECCIAWIFYGPAEQSAWKGSLDGIAIYFQNWKRVLGNAVKSVFLEFIATIVLFVVIAATFFGIFSLLGGGLWNLLAILIGFLVALAIKQAFMDSWIMIRMLVTFLDVAPTTEIRLDMYGKLSTMSPAFRQMTTRAQDEINASSFRNNGNFCNMCGLENPINSRFCKECGSQI